MNDAGPVLETLTHRLAETPEAFLAEPRIGAGGQVAVAALVNDLLRLHGARAPLAALAPFHGGGAQADRNRLALAMIAVWLMADDWFVAARPAQADVLGVLGEAVAELAGAAPAHQFVNHPERREELVRVTLARLGARPAGETPEQASDRLSGISGAERRRLLEASRAAERRAGAIRAALARKAAEEAADKWTRE